MVGWGTILAVANKGGQNESTKENKKKPKQNFFHGFPYPAYRLANCPHWGLNPDLSAAEALLYPLGYGPSLTYFCTGVVFIFGPTWFSAIIGFS